MRRYKQSGFTIVELMTALLVAAILLGVGVPSFISFLDRNKLSTVSSQLVSVLQGARERAVASNDAAVNSVSIVQDANGVTCTFQLEGVDTSCESLAINDGDITLKGTNGTLDQNNFSFHSSGKADQEYQFVVQHADVASHQYVIRIFSSGRISLKKKTIQGNG